MQYNQTREKGERERKGEGRREREGEREGEREREKKREGRDIISHASLLQCINIIEDGMKLEKLLCRWR